MIKIGIETDLYKFKNLQQYKVLNHFITSRYYNKNGEKKQFNLSVNTQKIAEAENNRKFLANELNININQFVFQDQTHSDNITTIKAESLNKISPIGNYCIYENDALITNQIGYCLMVMAADCVPVLLYEPDKKVIAAVHSGWRGTLINIVSETIKRLINEFNINPKKIIAGIGPSIGACCFEVGKEVSEKFFFKYKNKEKYALYYDDKQKYHLDLWKIVNEQLTECGVKEENIELSDICTKCDNDNFFSARNNDNGRFSAGIMLNF